RFIGSEFFPDSDESQFSVNVKLPVGTRVEETEKFVEKVEQVINANVPEVNTIISNLGVPGSRSGSLFGQNTGSHTGTIQVSLVPPGQRKRSVFEIVKDLRPKLMAIPGGQVFANWGGFLKFLLNF